jgi:MoaA/NifB/PqqE/SkfB family radical SAM enzyme
MVIRGLSDADHPLLVHMIPTRRCNLACTYCNEYDDHSSPAPIETLKKRVDHLAKLGSAIITQSGGEPLLHPDLDELIAHVRSHGIIAGTITNGFLLNADRIKRLNRAGLDHLQISIDNVQPDDVSKKSLKTLDTRLELLAEHAEFHVNINSVLGSGVDFPEDALEITRRAQELGFGGTVGVIHDGDGQLRPLDPLQQRIFEAIGDMAKSSFGRINKYNPFQKNLVEGKPNNWWRCRAGGRYLYICEDGLVHYCSQQRGFPGTPLEEYTVEDIRREYNTEKSCAPYCTVGCVHQVSVLDRWRDPQTRKVSPGARDLVRIGA